MGRKWANIVAKKLLKMEQHQRSMPNLVLKFMWLPNKASQIQS